MLSNKEKELMTREEKIDFIKSNLPESVYNMFNKEWELFPEKFLDIVVRKIQEWLVREKTLYENPKLTCGGIR